MIKFSSSRINYFISGIFCFAVSHCALAQTFQNGSADKSFSTNWTSVPFDNKLFVENNGQFDNRIPSAEKIFFGSTLGKINASFTQRGLTYSYSETSEPKNKSEREKAERNGEEDSDAKKIIPTHFLNLIWEGANADAVIEAADTLNYYFTYAHGIDSTITAHAFRKIIYRNLYDGIDVEYFFPEGKEGLKYNIILKKGADVSKIKLRYEGAENILLNEEGNLIVKTSLGDFTDHAPVSYNSKGAQITSSFLLDKNSQSFSVNTKTKKGAVALIDPWTTNPLFTGGYNAAYEVDYDDSGNVYTYGGWAPSQLVKLNSAGVVQWRFNAVTINTDVDAQWGDFAVDRPVGTSYLIEGYNQAAAGGARVLKVNRNGALVGTFAGNANFEEMDRVAYHACTRQLVIGGGGTNATNQGCILDTNMTTFTPRNVLGANLPFHDMWLLAIDPTGLTCYMGSTNSCCNNNVAYDDRLLKLNVPALTASTFNLNISAFTWMPEALSNLLYMTWSGTPANGLNGLAASKNFLYLFDGADLMKFNKNTGAMLVDRTGIASQVQSWGGLDVDLCDVVYTGHNSAISVFNGATLTAGSAAISTIALTNTVYDVKLGKNYALVYASGKNFVSSIAVAAPTITFTHTRSNPSCALCNGSVRSDLRSCGTIDTTGATYLWSNGQTTHTATGLCPGNYSVTIIPAGLCIAYTDTFIVPCDASLPIELSLFEVRQSGKAAAIKWETESEVNNNYFVVEKSRDGINFIPLVKVFGRGNSTEHTSYSATDETPYSRLTYYHLKQVDFDGSISYSDIKSLLLNSRAEFIVKTEDDENTVTVLLQTQTKGNGTLSLSDYSGRVLLTKEISFAEGSNSFSINISSLAGGIYFATLDVDGEIMKGKFVKREGMGSRYQTILPAAQDLHLLRLKKKVKNYFCGMEITWTQKDRVDCEK